MLESIIKNYDELPLFLNAKNLSKVLGLSESSVYELMHEKDFPSLCIGCNGHPQQTDIRQISRTRDGMRGRKMRRADKWRFLRDTPA